MEDIFYPVPFELGILIAVFFICLIFILKHKSTNSKAQENQSATLAKDLKVDKIVAWIKNNQAKAAAIGVLIAALAYTQLANKPRTLADCYLKVSQEAMNDQAAKVGSIACRMKFKKEPRYTILPPKSENPFLNLPDAD